jgi:nucleotide-binding universal stress UspA family protein
VDVAADVGMERILVGLDGSPRSPMVIAAAADLARRVGAKLYLYRAVALPRELPAIALSMAPGEVAGMMERMAKEELEALAKTVPAELVADVRVSLAVPWQGVCEAAHAARADLIVVGSHGYGGLDRVLGTTAAKIVNHAEVSVLVVKSGRRIP